jgi:hypothetical protein
MTALKPFPETRPFVLKVTIARFPEVSSDLRFNDSPEYLNIK